MKYVRIVTNFTLVFTSMLWLGFYLIYQLCAATDDDAKECRTGQRWIWQ